jgi:hypothetical protein
MITSQPEQEDFNMINNPLIVRNKKTQQNKFNMITSQPEQVINNPMIVPNKKIVFVKTTNELLLENGVLKQQSSTQQSMQESLLATGVTFAIELLDYANGRRCPFTEYMRSDEADKFYEQDLDINKMYVLIRKFQKSYSYGIKPVFTKTNEERIYLAVCDVEAPQITSVSQQQVDDGKFFKDVLGDLNKVVEQGESANYVVFKKKSRVGSTETVIPCLFNEDASLTLIAKKSTNYLPITGQDENIITSTGMLNVFDFHESILILKYPTYEDFYYIMTPTSNKKDDQSKIQYQAKEGKNLTYVYKNVLYELAFPVFFNKTDSSYKYSFDIIDEIKKNNFGELLKSDRKGFREAYYDEVKAKNFDNEGNTYIGSLKKSYNQRNRDKELAMLKNILIKKFMENKQYQGKSETQIKEGLNKLFKGYQVLFKDKQKQKLVKQRIKKNFEKETVDDIETKLISTDDKLQIQALNQLLNDKYYNYKNPYTYIESGRRRNIIDKLTKDLNMTAQETVLRQQLEKKGKNILTQDQIQSFLNKEKRDVPTLLKKYEENKKNIEKLQEEIKNLNQQENPDVFQLKLNQIARLRNKENQLRKAINTKYKELNNIQELEPKDLQNLYDIRNLGYSIPYTTSGKQRESILNKLKEKFPQLPKDTTAPEEIKKSIDNYYGSRMTQSQKRKMLKERLKETDREETLKELITKLGKVDEKGSSLRTKLGIAISGKNNTQKQEIKQNLLLNQVEKQALLQSINEKEFKNDNSLTQDDLNTYRQIKNGPFYTNILSKKNVNVQKALVELKKEQLLSDNNQKIKNLLKNTKAKQYQEKALLEAVKHKMTQHNGYEDIFGQERQRNKDLQRELLRIAKKYPELELDQKKLQELRNNYPSYATKLATKASSVPGAITAGASDIKNAVSGRIASLIENIKGSPRYTRLFG